MNAVDGGRVPAVWGLELYRLESNLHVVAVRTGVGIAAGSTRVTLVATLGAGCSAALGAGGSAAACVASAASSAASAVAVVAAIRVDRQVEVNVGLALLDGLEHGSLSTAACHEVELGFVTQGLELLLQASTAPSRR